MKQNDDFTEMKIIQAKMAMYTVHRTLDTQGFWNTFQHAWAWWTGSINDCRLKYKKTDSRKHDWDKKKIYGVQKVNR